MTTNAYAALTDLTDATLAAMAIPARNAILDEIAQDAADFEYDADAAYERHLENVLYDENRAFEDWERSMGVVSWEEAAGMWA